MVVNKTKQPRMDPTHSTPLAGTSAKPARMLPNCPMQPAMVGAEKTVNQKKGPVSSRIFCAYWHRIHHNVGPNVCLKFKDIMRCLPCCRRQSSHSRTIWVGLGRLGDRSTSGQTFSPPLIQESRLKNFSRLHQSFRGPIFYQFP